MRIHRLAPVAAALLFSAAAHAKPELSSRQATRDLTILKQAMTVLHPGVYRRRTPQELDKAFASALEQVSAGASRAQMFLLAARLSAFIGCGHTWTNPLNQAAPVRALLARALVLPVRVRLLQGRLLATASLEPLVPAPMEILAIDGRSVESLVAELLPLLRADGFNDGKKRSQLDSGPNGGALDRLLPLLHPPKNGVYQLTLAGGSSVAVRAVSEAEREARLPAFDEAWKLSIDGPVATLTLPTFSFWRSDFDWKGFLDRAFATLESRQIKTLILDVRHNEGGDDAIVRELLSHLIAKPYTQPILRAFSAYERAPWILARFLDTWDFSFFDRTGQVTREGSRWVVTAKDRQRTTVTPKARFGGRVFTLIGPEMSSAGFILARGLRETRAATLVGQATGGTLRGLNGGELAWVTLPESGVAVDLPLLAWESVSEQPDTGIAPDVRSFPMLEDAAAGRDVELETALKLSRQ